MLPIALNPQMVTAGLAGEGEPLQRRLSMLRRAEVEPVSVALDARDFAGLTLLYVAGVERVRAAELAGRARAARVLVNVEDRPELCDFHVPAIVRRGDLIVAVSTGGRVPTLATRVREWLEHRFDDDWGDRVDELGAQRVRWRAEGVPIEEIAGRMRRIIDEKGWLP